MTEEDIAEIRISLFHFWLLVDGFFIVGTFLAFGRLLENGFTAFCLVFSFGQTFSVRFLIF